MSKFVHRLVGLLAACVACATSALAATIPLGVFSWNEDIPNNSGSFNIFNGSGINTLPPDFPITTALSLSSLTLTVHYSDATFHTYLPADNYFTLSLDGLSFNGGVIPIGGSNPLPIDATLTGSFSTTSIVVDGLGAVTILPTFTATILPSTGRTLSDPEDFAVINVETTGGTTPEPSSLLLAGLAVALALKWSTTRQSQGTPRLALN